MYFNSETYGPNPRTLLTSPGDVMRRLEAILCDKVMRFNPYAIDDATLLACAERAFMRPWPALTQMAVIHFLDIRRVMWRIPYDAMFYRIGGSPREESMSVGSLTRRVTYTATLRQVHVTVDGRPLTNAKMAERMQGRDYFVSHALPARAEGGRPMQAYRLFSLKGNDARRAETIRERMLESKIAMLNEILAHPYAPEYLRCSRGYIDYAAPISAAISAIRCFPEARQLRQPRDSH